MKNCKLVFSLVIVLTLFIAIPNNSYATNRVINGNDIEQFQRTKQDIQELWKNSNLKLEDGYSIYDEEPSYEAPYKGGVVKQEYLDRVLKNLNYYRYLVGSPQITTKMSNRQDLQAAVVIQYLYYKSTLDLTHTLYSDFEKPSDMTDEFYNLGAYARHEIISSTSYKTPVYPFFNESIFSITAGHRTSLLSPTTNKAEFGLGKVVYGNVHGSFENYNSTGPIAAYPAPGYFPKQDFIGESDWDIYLNPNNFQMLTSSESRNVEVTIKSSKKQETYTYRVDDGNLIISENTIFIKQPEIEKYSYYEGDYEVYVTNLKDVDGNFVDLTYTVSFFDKFEGIESNIKETKYEDRRNSIDFDGDYSENVTRKYLPKNVTLILESGSSITMDIKDYEVKLIVSNFYYDVYEYKPIIGELPSWVKDENNKFEPLNVFCYRHENFDSYDYSKIELKQRGEEGKNIELEFEPYTNVPGRNYFWIREKDGNVEKLENGSKYTIDGTKLVINNFEESDTGNYYLVNDYRSPSLYNTSITFSKKIKIFTTMLGDVNEDGFINSTDAAMVLDLFKNGGATQRDYELGDIDDDGNLNSTDASMILDIFKNGN